MITHLTHLLLILVNLVAQLSLLIIGLLYLFFVDFTISLELLQELLISSFVVVYTGCWVTVATATLNMVTAELMQGFKLPLDLVLLHLSFLVDLLGLCLQDPVDLSLEA